MKLNKTIKISTILFTGFFLAAGMSLAQTQAESPAQGVYGMTLWQMIKAGGIVMIPIGILSLIALTMIIYNLMTLHAHKHVPAKFCADIMEKLEKREFDDARSICTNAKENNNIIAKIVLAGLDKLKKTKNPVAVKEAMETRARIEISGLWQNLNYISDIAAIGPWMGLLGTVLGMIQSFNVIVVQSGSVKPILLAAGISKAMVTTAAGLIIAIPSLIFYSYFRGKLQQITNAIETNSIDIIKIIEKA